jgi:hypothetical protein
VQAEADIFGSTGSDRSIALYDLRHSTPIRKIVMQTNCNALAWNPMEPLNFVVASEDCNLYTYDMRKLDTATCVHEVRTAPPDPKFPRHIAAHCTTRRRISWASCTLLAPAKSEVMAPACLPAVLDAMLSGNMPWRSNSGCWLNTSLAAAPVHVPTGPTEARHSRCACVSAEASPGADSQASP